MLERLLIKRNTLYNEINFEWIKYREAIATDKDLDEIKIVYRRIKDLKEQIAETTKRINRCLNIRE